MIRTIFILLIFLVSVAARAEDRLLGTWKSDHDESMRFNNAHAQLTPKQTAFLDQLFGHLEMTFEAGTVLKKMPDLKLATTEKSSTFHGSNDTYNYRVLGTDEDSVAIYVEKELGRDRVIHLHFVGMDMLWIYSEESKMDLRELNIREYFRRQR